MIGAEHERRRQRPRDGAGIALALLDLVDELSAHALEVGGRERRLADQPQVVDMRIAGIDFGASRHAAAAIGCNFADPRRAGHIGNEVEPVVDVYAKAQVQIPAQNQPDAAVEFQAEAGHTDIETEVEAGRVGLAEVHAKLDRGTAAQRQLGGNFLCLCLHRFLELSQYRLRNQRVRSRQAVVEVVLERRGIRGDGPVAGFERVEHIMERGGNHPGAENVFQKRRVVVPIKHLLDYELGKRFGRGGESRAVVVGNIGERVQRGF